MPVSKLLNLITTCALLGTAYQVNAAVMSCAEKYDRYAEAQTHWQTNSAERATELLPEHKERINQYRDVQLTMIARRKLAVHLALENYPDQVASWGSINQWIELSPEFATQLSRLSSEFAALSATYTQQTSKPASASDAEFSARFRATVIADPEFMQLMDDFNRQSREINSLTCQK